MAELALTRRAALLLLAAATIASPAAAEDFKQTSPGELIAKYESDGGRNIPNFRFDPVHTAGGHYQITDTSWQRYAPRLGIDLDPEHGYPNAMSAPEQLQGQVAGLMWANEGYMPWTCCNKQLREHLNQQPIVKVRRVTSSAAAPGPETHPPVTPTVDATQTDPFSAEGQDGGSSFLITNLQEGK